MNRIIDSTMYIVHLICINSPFSHFLKFNEPISDLKTITQFKNIRIYQIKKVSCVSFLITVFRTKKSLVDDVYFYLK